MKRILIVTISLGVFASDWLRRSLRLLMGKTTAATYVVLYYHCIPQEKRLAFAGQMDTLIRRAEPLRADATASRLPGIRYVSVTFDDGYQNILDNALPELAQRRIPATIFIVSESLGGLPKWEDYAATPDPAMNEPIVTTDQLRKLPPDLVQIGSHTRTHPMLTQVSENEARNELSLSRLQLREIIERDVTLFSFPYGAFNDDLIAWCRDEGYQKVFTTLPGTASSETDEFVVGRVGVDPNDWPLEFRLKLSGAYRWLPRAYAFKRRMASRSKTKAPETQSAIRRNEPPSPKQSYRRETDELAAAVGGVADSLPREAADDRRNFKDSEIGIVEEFFELFKTPWEFYTPRHEYDVVIVTSTEVPSDLRTKVLVICNSSSLGLDDAIGIRIKSKYKCDWLEGSGLVFPIYGGIAVLESSALAFIRRKETSEIVGVAAKTPACQIIRIGYDLFQEVSFLLSEGQPAKNGHIPTLEMHIALLRTILTNNGIAFVEIPAVPAGHKFMVCLTHDVDFTGIREHKFDHTIWGFVYRASVGSLFEALKGKMKWSKCLQNWKAVLSLPLVYLGLLEDFWLEFDRYMDIEKGLGSTFFFIPFKNYPGKQCSRPAPKLRAAPYDLFAIKQDLRKLMGRGCEVGLHGIDAWQGLQEARTEKARIQEATGRSEVGIRMHWLYFDKGSPGTLEEAGFPYDSTFGYNDAVGFRGGTTQAFCPTRSKRLLELPLNIQDTALFYPSRMNLTESEALRSCTQLIESAKLFGGALTVNWHTRSLSPERLWGDFYAALLKQFQDNGAWFGTAENLVMWFRKRRAFRFDQVTFTEDGLVLRINGPNPDDLPPFLVRVHHPQSKTYDMPWKGEAELSIAI